MCRRRGSASPTGYETALATLDPLARWCEALITKPETRQISPELIYDAAVRRRWDEKDLRRLRCTELFDLERTG